MKKIDENFNLEEYLNSRSMTTTYTNDDYDYDNQTAEAQTRVTPPLSKKQRKKVQKFKRKQLKKQKKQKKRSFGKIILACFITIVIIALVIGATQFQKLQQIAEVFDGTSFSSTQSQRGDAKGILVIGTDLSSGEESLNGYADSITYFGVNTTKKQAASLPIYRDARIPVSCNNNQADNINRITKKFNVSCLAESTSKMLNLPVDYYVSITIDGVETIVDKIGGVYITPTETFSSEYGRDNKIHTFTKGVKQHMDGATVVAYLRDRQHGNGEGRANRQLSAIQAVKSACSSDILKCYNDVLPSVNKMVRTNVPVDKIAMLSAIGDTSYNSKAFSVISGQNTQLKDGWSQIIDENDKKTKTDYFRQNIFT